MARGSQPAQQSTVVAQQGNADLQAKSNALFSVLAPQLTREATNPTGISAPDKAKLNTAAQQSAGGAASAAIGRAGLKAARTRNAGTGDAAEAQAVRDTGSQATDAALKTELADASAKNQERQAGISGLTGLEGGTQSGALGYLGQVAPLVGANTQAASQSWDWAKYLLDPVLSAAGNAAHV